MRLLRSWITHGAVQAISLVDRTRFHHAVRRSLFIAPKECVCAERAGAFGCARAHCLTEPCRVETG